MKNFNVNVTQQSKARMPETTITFPIGLRNNINLLILVHFVFFTWYLISGPNGLIGQYWSNGTFNHFVNYNVPATYSLQHIQWQTFTSIFTYQFVHLNASEFLLSISMLWLFGNLLITKIGSAKTILLYFSFVALSAIVYNLSHLLFPIFSGPRGLLDGAFSGVLGVMTTTVYFYGTYQLRVSDKIKIELWIIYVVAILLSLFFVYEHNLAYIIVYITGIYLGVKVAEVIQRSDKQASAGSFT
ncbi:membrane associated rhomboid family serine protease [Pedobacter sp. CAN_A7]|uniref:rhomboid family intramembrane serine protease n=1 Tax=Pedobacter sp. CAN_A7 TaxID=2787722 RepID=UPI0018CA4C3C